MSAPFVTKREFAKLAACDEKQVRRAVEAGKLKTDAAGLIDPALVNSGWRKPIRSSKAVADTSKVSAPTVRTPHKNPAGSVRTDITADDTPAQAAAKLVAATGATHDLAEAIRIKENFNALLKQLEYQRELGEVVDLSLAQAVIFEEARAQRDSWMNWPMRVGPMLAADLGLDADVVTEALKAHVHKQIASLGDPEADFTEREG